MNNRKGFTLIELLAVIVILAIIALIATPIILGIIEDAKRDAFLRSVELVVSTTDMDISTKTYESTYMYEITDGDISNLDIPVKNTKGMNGSVKYDNKGNTAYAVNNGKYCVVKEYSGQAIIKDYDEICEYAGGGNFRFPEGKWKELSTYCQTGRKSLVISMRIWGN